MNTDLTEYIEQHTTPESDVLCQITRHTNLEVLNPHMLSGHVQGRLLSMLSHMIRPRRILELGTFTGYSALCLAEGLAPDGRLVTIEHNDELEDTIRHNFSLSPLSSQIDLVIADAKEYLTSLHHTSHEVNNTSHAVPHTREASTLHSATHVSEANIFDLVFIDPDKREYCAYLDLVYPLVRTGGWILADNTLWDGHIIDPAYDHDKQTLGLRAFNDKLSCDTRFSQVILPIRDGLTIIRKL